MDLEIERRFLINTREYPEEFFKERAWRATKIEQGYFSDMEQGVCARVRTCACVKDRLVEHTRPFARITIKRDIDGISRQEIEHEIKFEEAQRVLDVLENIVHKTRYFMTPDPNDTRLKLFDSSWDVDWFRRQYPPRCAIPLKFAMAEIELPSDDTQVTLPPWVAKEVTLDTDFCNVNLHTGKYYPKWSDLYDLIWPSMQDE